MEPETLPELVQLNLTELVPDIAAPEPVLAVAQPATTPTTTSNPTFEVVYVIQISLQDALC
jgi:hypothetical protein